MGKLLHTHFLNYETHKYQNESDNATPSDGEWNETPMLHMIIFP